MKKIILIGKSAAGKTTLCQYISNQKLKYNKTQTVEFIGDTMIDTPGEYLERRQMYRALIVTSVEADVIILVHDATDENTMFAPQFSSMFTKPVIGVVAKSDLADEIQISRARQFLKIAGASKIFVTSSVEGMGFEDLYAYLENEQRS